MRVPEKDTGVSITNLSTATDSEARHCFMVEALFSVKGRPTNIPLFIFFFFVFFLFSLSEN